MGSVRVALWRGMYLGAALSAVAGQALAGSPSVALVPMPKVVELRPGMAALGPEWTISSTSVAEDDQTAQLLAQEAATCYGWAWRVVPAGTHFRTIELRATAPPVRGPALFAEQGYRLDVTREHVVIEGASPQGRFYGVQTLRQLLRAHPDGVIPCVSIKDYPALAWRGISDDISRGQVSTVEDFKAIIRQLAYYKVNLYQLYIEDMFLFEGTPTSGQTRGAITKSDLAQLVAEGRSNHVVVSPIFETLAHQERLLSLKEHQHLAAGSAEGQAGTPESAWGLLVRVARGFFSKLVLSGSAETATPAAFSASNPHALRLVQSLVDEIAVVTRGPFFHIGGDEWQLPATAAGTATPAGDDGIRSYGRYLGQVADHLRERYGCRAMVYGDVIVEHPEAARDLPRNVIVIDWQYQPQDSFPSLRTIKDQGFRDVMVSPGLWTWRTFYPNYAWGFRNVASFAQAGKREKVMGCIAATWGDGGAENLRENNWAGYAFSAAASWEATAPAPGPFLSRFVVAHYGTDSPELARAERLLGWQEFDGVGWAGRLYHRPLPVRQRPQRWVERMKALEADMRQVERDLAAANGAVRFNQDHLAAARHCARRYLYIAERELILDSAGRKIGGRTAAQLPPAERERIVSQLGRMEATANALQAEFGQLWLRNNRSEGLAEIEERMAKQGIMLRRLRELARRGSLKVDDTFSHMQALNNADAMEPDASRR